LAPSPTDTPLTKVLDELWQTARECERVSRALVQQPVLYAVRQSPAISLKADPAQRRLGLGGGVTRSALTTSENAGEGCRRLG